MGPVPLLSALISGDMNVQGCLKLVVAREGAGLSGAMDAGGDDSLGNRCRSFAGSFDRLADLRRTAGREGLGDGLRDGIAAGVDQRNGRAGRFSCGDGDRKRGKSRLRRRS